jgi:hypothetical protein
MPDHPQMEFDRGRRAVVLDLLAELTGAADLPE